MFKAFLRYLRSCCFAPYAHVKYSRYRMPKKPMAHIAMKMHDSFEDLQSIHGDVIILRLSSGMSSVCKPICRSIVQTLRQTFMEGAREPSILAHAERKP